MGKGAAPKAEASQAEGVDAPLPPARTQKPAGQRSKPISAFAENLKRWLQGRGPTD
jgi:hypothetical protein